MDVMRASVLVVSADDPEQRLPRKYDMLCDCMCVMSKEKNERNTHDMRVTVRKRLPLLLFLLLRKRRLHLQRL